MLLVSGTLLPAQLPMAKGRGRHWACPHGRQEQRGTCWSHAAQCILSNHWVGTLTQLCFLRHTTFKISTPTAFYLIFLTGYPVNLKGYFANPYDHLWPTHLGQSGLSDILWEIYLTADHPSNADSGKASLGIFSNTPSPHSSFWQDYLQKLVLWLHALCKNGKEKFMILLFGSKGVKTE